MSNEGTNIRVVISAESNKRLQAIQAHLMAHGLAAGKREAIEFAIEVSRDSISRPLRAGSNPLPKPEPKQRKR